MTAVKAAANFAAGYEKNVQDVDAWCANREIEVHAAVIHRDFLVSAPVAQPDGERERARAD